jgi:hypothetical protein
MTNKGGAERTVREIRKSARRRYSVDGTTRIALGGLEVEAVLLNCVVTKASTTMSIIAGRRNCLMQARNTYLVTYLLN